MTPAYTDDVHQDPQPDRACQIRITHGANPTLTCNAPDGTQRFSDTPDNRPDRRVDSLIGADACQLISNVWISTRWSGEAYEYCRWAYGPEPVNAPGEFGGQEGSVGFQDGSVTCEFVAACLPA